ncbi:MAG: hypothetical protein KGJ78_16815, partial [Alphaproteobacteria bacterium]|nr:hypothetical protein [Alphaproteobacteria bacterium]
GDGNFQVTALRVPMIYGRGAGKKLHLLAKLLVRATLLPVPPYAIQRSVVHLENLASAIATVLKARCNGVLFAADPEPLTLELLADVLSQQTGRRIRLITMPAWLFQPLHHVAPGLYDSLYSSSLIEPSACVELSTYGKRSLREGLKDILA